MSDSSSTLTTDRLRFGYPGHGEFLGPLDVEITAGQVWGVIGPNGAGKSTLLRLCAGLLRPTAGRVLLTGQTVHRMPALRRACTVAFLPQ